MKRILSFLLVMVIALTSGSCQRNDLIPPSGSGNELLEENIPDDNVRNWYEMFVYSFADSDGDRIGDFKGAAEKLPYVRELGFTGIWLMPVMPSPSYHKYDVTDYYSIDPAYGTMEDFKAFLEKAHELGIKVILDLVLNHTSNEHPWFQNAKTGEEAQYREYYNFQNSSAEGFQRIGDSYFECRFVSTMPDLNLDSPAVRDEIVNIMTWWLGLGVDGFRLDAVTSYYTGNSSKNIAFLTWLNGEAKRIDPDCYLVGECWADESTIASYYASGLDSFFYFPMSTGSGRGEIVNLLSEESADRGAAYGQLTAHLEQRFGSNALMAPFLDNHDTDRFASVLGLYDMPRLKAAYGMLAMMRGGSFVYYGSEAGMVGSGPDPNKRIGMYWDSLETVTACPPGTTEANYPLGNIPTLLSDDNSLLHYLRRAMNLRNAYPEIARGTTLVQESEDPDVCILKRTWNGSAVTIVLNLSNKPQKIDGLDGTLAASLDANLKSGTGISLADGVLTVDPWGIAVIE